jgi:chemotaxis protein MotB
MAARGGKKIVIVKKKAGGHGGHHGGSWKVAYADFVTAMMAFFMVMWILGMDDQTKSAIEGYFSNPVGYRKGYGAGSSPIAIGSTVTNLQRTPLRLMVRANEEKTFEAARERIMDKLQANDSLAKLNAQVEVAVTSEGLRIELIESGSGDVYFPLGSAQIKPAIALVLQVVGSELATLSHPIVLEGHTDAAKFSPDASYTNWELSADRANAARRVLEASGVGQGRLVEVRGYADRRLRDVQNPSSAANRRISLLLPFTNVPEGVVGDTPVTDAPPTSGSVPPIGPPIEPPMTTRGLSR